MKKVFYALVTIIASSPLASIAHAVAINIPGTSPNSSSTPGAFVANFYQFALMIGGVLAFGIIVYGGVRYMASVGNPSGQSDAREWIEAALLGLLLLVGAYFILNVVNPKLTTLSMPTLPTVNVVQTGTGVCNNITCQSGFVPVTVGGDTNSPSCVCENANGTQGCGGAVAGTATGTASCPTGQTCVETQTDPITYSCQATAQYDCGVPANHYGKCEPQYDCVSYITNPDTKTVAYECKPG
jgi:hypothetical protein